MDDALDRFRLEVIADPALRAELMAETDPVRFPVRVVVLAHRLGIDVDVDAVRAGLEAARTGWTSRWF